MANRGRGRRGRPQDTGQAPPVFDKQTFAEVVGIAAIAIAQATHSAPEDHGHVRVRCHPGDGLADRLQGRYRL